MEFDATMINNHNSTYYCQYVYDLPCRELSYSYSLKMTSAPFESLERMPVAYVLWKGGHSKSGSSVIVDNTYWNFLAFYFGLVYNAQVILRVLSRLIDWLIEQIRYHTF